MSDLIKRLQFQKPHQSRHLINPTREQVIEAASTLSHHLFIESDTNYQNIMSLKGWHELPNSWLTENQRHYINEGYVAKHWSDLWGTYNFHNFYKNLADWIRPGGRMVEIGTFHGRSIAHFAEMVRGKNVEIFSLDTYYQVHLSENCMRESTYYRNLRNFRSLGLLNEVQLVPTGSQNLGHVFKPESVDVVYIDGNHAKEAVDRDIAIYYPMVIPGGIISGHDYAPQHGVFEAVNQFFGADKITVHPCTSWEFRKPL